MNRSWTLFKNKLTELVNMFVPAVDLNNSTSNLWFTRFIKTMHNKKILLFRAAKKRNVPDCWSCYYTYVRAYRTLVHDSESNFFHTTLPSILVSSPHHFWNVFRLIHNISLRLISVLGDVVPNHQSASILNKVFSYVFSSPSILPLQSLVSCDFFPMNPIVIDFDGIVNIINSLKISSSGGMDDINSKILCNTTSA